VNDRIAYEKSWIILVDLFYLRSDPNCDIARMSADDGPSFRPCISLYARRHFDMQIDAVQ
jgi:hypothetical protein